MPLVYEELRRRAGTFLRGERDDHTLQSSALVHEAFLRLLEIDRISWNDRAHFFALCGRMMRRILIDHSRRHQANKRGGATPLRHLSETDAAIERHPDLIALDTALHRLARRNSVQARIVELRYFGGLDREEIASVLGISSATVTRRWRMARAWLFNQLRGRQLPAVDA